MKNKNIKSKNSEANIKITHPVQVGGDHLGDKFYPWETCCHMVDNCYSIHEQEGWLDFNKPLLVETCSNLRALVSGADAKLTVLSHILNRREAYINCYEYIKKTSKFIEIKENTESCLETCRFLLDRLNYLTLSCMDSHMLMSVEGFIEGRVLSTKGFYYSELLVGLNMNSQEADPILHALESIAEARRSKRSSTDYEFEFNYHMMRTS